jgi:hypothetical protein
LTIGVSLFKDPIQELITRKGTIKIIPRLIPKAKNTAIKGIMSLLPFEKMSFFAALSLLHKGNDSLGFYGSMIYE